MREIIEFWAYLSRAHDEGVRYAEIFFDPQAHTSRLQLERNAIEIAWLPGAVKDQLLAEIEQYAADVPDPGGT